MCARTIQIAQTRSSHPLISAVQNGNVERVKELLQTGEYNINDKDRFGSTPLHAACSSGSIELVQIFTSISDIDLNQKNATNDTPLSAACRSRQQDTALWLIEHYSDHLDLNEGSMPPLHAALYNRQYELLEVLLSMPKVDVNAPMKYLEQTPLGFLCNNSRNLDIINYFLEKAENVDINKMDQEGKSPLFIACQSSQIDIVERLLQFRNIQIDPLCSLMFRLSSQNRSHEKFEELNRKMIPNIDFITNALDLSDFDGFHIPSLQNFFLEYPNRITSINLDKNRIQSNDTDLLKALGHSSLKTIRISENLIGNKGCQALCEALLKRNKCIECLEITRNSIGDEGCRYLSHLIRNNLIRQLYISCEALTEESFAELSNAVEQSTSLFVLTSSITDKYGTIYVESIDVGDKLSIQACRQLQVNEQTANHFEFRNQVNYLWESYNKFNKP
eukprot:gb/GECH01010295.1/.p1 GENE.gb/GECH01010295.1/~~gb/GECH01010295.1/.p1  ORF type:complete len:447 (+),score=111.88 gb/GECH01010295.1/:1-1341(+)